MLCVRGSLNFIFAALLQTTISRTHILVYLYTEFWTIWLAYLLSHDLIGSIILTSSYSSRRSCISNWYTYITRSVTLSPPSLTLSLKILPISRLSTRGTVSSNLIYCYPSLIPPSVASVCYTLLIAFIFSINKVMPFCFYYVEKGLVYIIIAAPSNC